MGALTGMLDDLRAALAERLFRRAADPLAALAWARERRPAETSDEADQRVWLLEDRLAVSLLAGENHFHTYLPMKVGGGTFAHALPEECPACQIVARAQRRIDMREGQDADD